MIVFIIIIIEGNGGRIAKSDLTSIPFHNAGKL